ncbi:Fe-S cluster assembly protein SufD [Vampirovibrio sp.]|uniref:Fe-S cluster assembly protein SufD n=1 Tax=Vampirovibrio sp. TaxID=2717857 RepID=UPI0035942131
MVASAKPQSVQTLYEQSFRQRLQAILPETADWLQALRLNALSRFDQLGLPTRKLEAWKYINIRPLLGLPFQPHTAALPVSKATLQPYLLGEPGADVIHLVFVNGRFDADVSSTSALPAGVVVGSLKAAMDTQPEPVKSVLAQGLAQEPDAFVALNTALFEDGALIHVPDDTTVTPLIQVLYLTTGSAEPRAAYPRNLISLGRNAQVNMAIAHVGLGEHLYFNNSVQEFLLAEGAQAECSLVLNEAPQGWHLTATRSTLAENAKLTLSTVTLSGQTARHSVSTLLKGENAEVTLNGLDVLTGSTEIYHQTVTEHWVPHCSSDQFYKGILDDAGKSEFNGLVFVAAGANGTNSQQLNKNLLLSDEAKVWTRPQLQINADDVKCAHGATVGQLEADQLFYLASRGLSRELAQSLLTYGFAEEIIQRIANPLVRHWLDGRVLENLHRADASLKRQLGA